MDISISIELWDIRIEIDSTYISNITDICKYNFLSVFSRQLDSNSKLDLFIHVWYSYDFLLLLYNNFLVRSSVVFIFSPLFIITAIIVIIIAIKITSGCMRLWKEDKKRYNRALLNMILFYHSGKRCPIRERKYRFTPYMSTSPT